MNENHLETLLTNRRSVRGFLNEPLPQETLLSIFEMARSAPSNCNIQPWKTYVATGPARENISAELYQAAATATPPHPDFTMIQSYEGDLRQRQVECAMALYNNLGIERSDKKSRNQAMLENFRFFGAPHVAFVTMPKELTTFNAMDVGIYLQTLLLSMTRHGVASCAQGALALYPDIVRETLNIPKNEGIMVGISFGIEDKKMPANNTKTSRLPLADQVTFINS